MRVVLFYHSLVSDWNHGNAHFLRGIVTELLAHGHDVSVYEPRDGWSLRNLRAEHGDWPIAQFHSAYPALTSTEYSLAEFDLNAALARADLVIVHEWNEHELVRRIGQHRQSTDGYRLLFHDTHHRAVTDPASMARYDLSNYDGVLAFGSALRDLYLQRRWARRVWTWHEAADSHIFHPVANAPTEGDLIWIGNWGDEERTAELHEFLLAHVQSLHLRARIHGVRYPEDAKQALASDGIEYSGWLPNFAVPQSFARFRVTVHIPRRPYVRLLPGIPTIRVFEAMACGIPLVCSPWTDSEHLFTPGKDFLIASTGGQMRQQIQRILNEPALASELASHARQTIESRHTCAHRVDELMRICEELDHPATLAESGSYGSQHA